ncbi:MAG: NAD(P)/FAD-dependent oxidoreductase [Candidatus Limnocylindria bacterium]
MGGIHPTGTRRSWWLREALAAEAVATPWVAGPAAAPPLRGTITADVVIVGGGYTGMWAASRLTELEPGARVVLLEADICGGGPSGRNGGFVTNWWDELPTLIDRYGEAGALAAARASEDAVADIGAWCERHGVDAWFTRAGSLQVSAAPAQDGAWDEAVAACRAHGVGDRYVPMSAPDVRSRVRSPVFRDGVLMPGAATLQPATLARGLRRVLLERGVTIREGTRVVAIDGQAPGGRPGPRRSGVGPVRVRTVTADGGAAGQVIAGSAVVTLNAWAAAWPWYGRRLVTWSSYMVLTEPIPERLADIGWTGGEGLTDARFTLHYLRTTPDGRIAIGGGGGRAGFGGRIDGVFTDDYRSAARAAAGLRRLFPSLRDVKIWDAWGGPIDISADHLPWTWSVPGRPIHAAHGYSGNGVGPSLVLGRVLAAQAVEAAGDAALALPFAGGRQPRPFPPEPARSIGARLIREAASRRESREERGRPVGPLTRELSRMARRLGYHLGPD